MAPFPPATIEPELEPNIAHLVNALNAFEAIQTIGSCGGHDDPSPA